tara:strand:- start:1095 stop:2033 length:939 start_codon:yes stop_codon:yes gene_type:complete
MTLEEQKLRKQIRKIIRTVKDQIEIDSALEAFAQKIVLQKENRIRKVIRSLILEVAAEDPEADPHENTGMNFLRKLFKNTSMLSTLRTTYKLMTTDPEQRRSFRAHIVTWVQETLKTLRLNDQAGKPKQKAKLTEQRIQVDVTPDAGDIKPGEEEQLRSQFIDMPDAYGDDQDQAPEDVSPEIPGGEEDPDEGRGSIAGGDTTGRDTADQVYDEIEGNIVPYYARLNHPDDLAMFESYLIANLKLYFDKWEKELQRVIQEPTNQEYQDAAGAADEALPPDDMGMGGADMGGFPPPDMGVAPPFDQQTQQAAE